MNREVQPSTISLCTRGARHIAEFKAKYPGIKTGAGWINFKITDPVPVAAMKKVVKQQSNIRNEPARHCC